MISIENRKRIDQIIKKIALGEIVTLKERLYLHKFAIRFPAIAGKMRKALEVIDN